MPFTDVSTSVNNQTRIMISVRFCWQGGLKSTQQYSDISHDTAPRQGSVDPSLARGLTFKVALIL